MDLSGTWRAAAADEELRRIFHSLKFDDTGWENLKVPGHWSECSAFDNETSILYRKNFEHSIPSLDSGRSWLELDGIFYQGDVYLDGVYIGDTEGYFIRHAFDITDLLRSRKEHNLSIEVNCSPGGTKTKRRGLLGVFETGNDMVPTGNPGGIWGPARLRHTGTVRIHAVRAICLETNPTRAVVGIRAMLVSPSPRTVQVITEIAGSQHRSDHSIAEGMNEVEWRVEVSNPELWWPHRLGDQPLYELNVRVETRQNEVSDQHGLRIGLRSVAVKRWQTLINGERLFLKGANVAPATGDMAHTNSTDIDRQLDLAKDAGLDLVRPYAHVAHDLFYDRADEIGMLVWQDLPLQGQAANSLRKQAVRQARSMVDQLGHHPSIFTWNAHVSPAPEIMTMTCPSTSSTIGKIASHQLPTWSKSVLDRSIKREFESQDSSRRATAFTGVLPHLPRLDASATHLWFGWRRGLERDLTEYAAQWPAQVGFVAEFGAQSIPTNADFIDAHRWPNIGWSRLAKQHGYESVSFGQYAPPYGHRSFKSWQQATQAYQAELLRRQIETLRRLKYRPTGGFCFHHLIDSSPAVSASIVDHRGDPKLAFQAVREACLPVIVVADRFPAELVPGSTLSLDIQIINDLNEMLPDAIVEAELHWPGDSRTWRYTGTITADSVLRVGTLSWIVPETIGPATLTLRLSGPINASNRYDTILGAMRAS